MGIPTATGAQLQPDAKKDLTMHQVSEGASDKELNDSIREESGELKYIESNENQAKFDEYRRRGLSEDDAQHLCNYSVKQERAVYRKVDFRVVPLLSLLYLISHLDRANIGNAKIEGLEKSLHMRGNDYNIAVSIFFIPYILFEVPSNVLLAKFKRPSRYLGGLVIAWGSMVTLGGVVTNLAGLCVIRFLVGLFEAGFFPGAVWLISQWYPPNRTQSRTAIFYVSSAVSGSFSGLLAAGIAQMDGVGNYEGWRWIFIIEGLASVALGVAALFCLPDTPSLSGRWLNADERRYLNLMHFITRGESATEVENPKKHRLFNWKTLRSVVTDPNLVLQGLAMSASTVPNNGLKFTMPQIISNMGFRSTTAQLLTAPPYCAGAIAAVLSGLWADKLSRRMPFVVFFQLLVVIGMSVLFSFAPRIADNIPLCYTMVVLACMGIYPITPGCNTWAINNLAGAEKRSMGIAYVVTLANCGGFIGSWVFLNSESPRYPTGFGSCLAFAAAGMASAFLLEFIYWRHNKKWASVPTEEIMAKYSPEKLREMGDKAPTFKYFL